MNRSCFALSILMASLSASLLWGDAAKSHRRAAYSPAPAPREATPRPPRVEDCASGINDADVCSSRSVHIAYDDFECGYSCFPYDTCTYDPRFDATYEDAIVHPADLPNTIQSSKVRDADGHGKVIEIDPLFLSHYDPVYDAAVYGVDVYLTEPVAYSMRQAPYAYQTYDYEPYSGCYPECYGDEFACYGYDYGFEEKPGASESAAKEPQTESPLYGHYYEYNDNYDYNYDYQYDYDYQYEYPFDGPASTDEARNVTPALSEVQLRIVMAYLYELAGDSLDQCEPLHATMEAGCKIVAWSSGFDASRLWDAAGAELAEFPHDRSTR